MSENYMVIEDFNKKFFKRRGYFGNQFGYIIDKAVVKGNEEFFRADVLESDESSIIFIGGIMEQTQQALQNVNEEAKKSVKILEDSFNDVKNLKEMLWPELKNLKDEMRISRQTVVRELQKSLLIMKDVRKFFLEKEHKIEMERLEKFVVLAERLKALISDGTMDAIADVILKLEVTNEKSTGNGGIP